MKEIDAAIKALEIADNIALVGAAYTPKSIEVGLKKIQSALAGLRSLKEPDLSALSPKTQAHIRQWLADGTFVERAIATLQDQEKELMAYEKLKEQGPVAMLTEKQRRYILDLALDLEKTGRIVSLSDGQERSDMVARNRNIQCALEDYLRNLTHSAPEAKQVACDMGQMCLNCQPRGPNGECPDQAPEAKQEARVLLSRESFQMMGQRIAKLEAHHAQLLEALKGYHRNSTSSDWSEDVWLAACAAIKVAEGEI